MNGTTMTEVWLGGDPAESARQRAAGGAFEGEISYRRIDGFAGLEVECLLQAEGVTHARTHLQMVGVPIHKSVAERMPADHELAVWLPSRWLGQPGTGGLVVRALRTPFAMTAEVEMGAEWLPPRKSEEQRAKSETGTAAADPRARAQGGTTDLIDRRHRGMKPERLARLTEAARLMDAGYAAPYIARQMGVHEDTVNDWRRELRSMAALS